MRYKHISFKKNYEYQSIPTSIRDRATNENWINTLAYFIMLKSKFSNSIIYDYNLQKLAKLLNVSQSTIWEHLKIMKEKGLVSFSGNNICLIGLKNLLKIEKENYGYDYLTKEKKKIFLLKIKVADNKSAQVSLIRFTYQRKSIIYQQKAIHRKSKIILEAKESKLYKKSKRFIEMYGGLQRLESSFIGVPVLSNNSFGVMINKSKYTAKRVTKILKKMKLIDVQPMILPLRENGKIVKLQQRKYFRKLYPDAKYKLFNGTVCIQLPNEIRLLEKCM